MMKTIKKQFKLFRWGAVCLAAFFLLGATIPVRGQYSGTGKFTKITSLVELTDGYYVVAYGTTQVMSNSNNGTLNTNVAMTGLSGSTITNPATTVVWKIETDGSNKTIYSEASERYVTCTGTSNGATGASATVTTQARFTFEYDGTISLFKCQSVANSGRYLQYNTGSPRFAFYNGGQQHLTLYKMEGSTTPDPTAEVVGGDVKTYEYTAATVGDFEETIQFKVHNATDNLSLATIVSANSAKIEADATPSTALQASNFPTDADTIIDIFMMTSLDSETTPGTYQDTVVLKQGDVILAKAVINIVIIDANAPSIHIAAPTEGENFTADSVHVEFAFANIGVAGTINAELGGSLGGTINIEGGDGTAELWLRNLATGEYSLTAELVETGNTENVIASTTVPTTFTVTLPKTADVTFTPVAGNFEGSTDVTLASTSDNAEIYYTTNGSDPKVNGTLYESTPINLTATTTIKAYALAPHCDASEITEATYTRIVSAPVATNASDTTSKTFTANWNAVAVADEYELSVSYQGIGNIEVLNEDFAGISSGNSTTTSGSSTAWDGNSNFPTKAIVYQAGGAVKLGSGNDPGSMTTKALDLSGGEVTVSFKVKGWTTVEGNILVKVDNGSNTTVTYTAVIAAAFEQKSVVFPAATATSTVTIATSAKRAFIDDVVISVAGLKTTYALENENVGNVTTYEVTNLTPETEYFYTVKAKDDALTSVASNEISVKTLAEPVIAAEEALAFGNVIVAKTKTLDFEVLTEDIIGTVAYEITGGAAAYSVVEGDGWNDKTGGTLKVTFNPAAAQAYSGTLTLSSLEAENVVVALSGTGVIPSLSVDKPTVHFSNTAVDTLSPAEEITVSSENLGEEVITFELTDETNFTLNQTDFASTGKVSVTFYPRSESSFNAKLYVKCEALNLKDSVTLSGTGISASTPAISASPRDLAFSNVYLSENSTKTVTVTHENLESETVSFELSETTNFSLDQSGYSTSGDNVSITFTPTTAGAHNAKLYIKCETKSVADTVIITGTGAVHAPVALAAEDVAPKQFTAYWNKVAGATSYELSVYVKSSSEAVTGSPFTVTDTFKVVADLSPETGYAYTVKAINNAVKSAASNEILVSTIAMPDVATVVVTPAAGEYLTAQTVTLSCATEDATIEYRLRQGTSNVWTAYTEAGFVISSTDTLDVRASKTDYNTTTTLGLIYKLPTEVANIAAFKATSTSTNTTKYRITGDVIYVWRDGRNMYIKDATGGLTIYDNSTSVITTSYNEGDTIRGGIAGTLTVLNGLYEMIPLANTAAGIAGSPVEPIIVTMEDLLADFGTYQSQLIKIEGATFASTNAFDYATNRNINIRQNESTMICRNHYTYPGFIDGWAAASTTKLYDITGFAIPNNTDRQIAPRSTSDISAVPVPEVEVVGSSVKNYNIFEGDNLNETLSFKAYNITGTLSAELVKGGENAAIEIDPLGAITLDPEDEFTIALSESGTPAVGTHRDTVVISHSGDVLCKVVINLTVNEAGAAYISITAPVDGAVITTDSVVTKYMLKNIDVAGTVRVELQGSGIRDSITFAAGEGSDGTAQITLRGLASGSYSLEAYVTEAGSEDVVATAVAVNFSVNLPDVATPAFVNPTGTYNDSVELDITCATDGADIYYSLNGGEMLAFDAAFYVKETSTVKAIAVKAGMDTSAVATATYAITKPVVSTTYDLVTSADQLIAGKKYIIAGKISSDAWYGLGYQSSNNRPAVALDTISSDVLGSFTATPAGTTDNQTNVYEITLGGTNDAYTLRDISGQYLYAAGTGTQNYLKLQASAVNWTISVEETGVATLTCTGVTTTRNIMRFNPNTSGNPLFSCYGSGQQNIYLYVEHEDIPEVPTIIVPSTLTVNSPLVGTPGSNNVTIRGALLDANVTVAIEDDVNFSVSEDEFDFNDVNAAAGVNLEVTYNGSAANAITTITLTSGSVVETIAVTGTTVIPIEVANLRALRDSVNVLGASASRYYKVTGEVFVSGTSINRNQKWVQDATAGILIDDNSDVGGEFNIGDGVTGIIGTVALYSGLKQFVPYMSFGTATSTGETIEPIVLTYDEYAADIDAYESRLLRFNELTWASTGTFATNQNYNMTDAGENTVVIRTSIYQADYIGEAIPTGRYDIIGVGGNYNGDVQITPRSLSDMISNPVVGNEFDGLASDGLVVYPNPANGVFNVKVATPSVVTIFNAVGAKIGVVPVNSETAVRSLGSGLYLLRAVDANGKVSTQRVIVK